jgi:AraC family transcriptional regulator of adaptative response/methylated-DNA-[protein]-cysteine methyltransferase
MNPAPSSPAAQRRWRAVVSRNADADGQFVYAVRTTGVYCRPSCPSRRPLAHNVRYFATPAAAEQAGFRPCRRCRPERVAALDDAVAARIRAACAAIEQAESIPSLAGLAAHAGLSRFHFQRLFKRVVGVTPKEYYAAMRRRRLQRALASGAGVDAAVYEAGFGSSSRVYERTASLLGMSPAAYARGAPGERIRCGYVRTALGWLGVAMTDRGVCAIEFGASRDALAQTLRRRFAQAAIAPADAALRVALARLAQFVAQPQAGLDLPLDVRGTAFQHRVWQELQSLPVGTTVTYGELARRVGNPRGARAAARACATNPVALAVPCHRVIAADGALGGYRWGVARKRALIAREQAAANPAPKRAQS